MMKRGVPGGLAPWRKEQAKQGPENSSRRLPGPCETIGPRPTRTAIPCSSGRCPAGWTTGPSGCHVRIRTAILGVKVLTGSQAALRPARACGPSPFALPLDDMAWLRVEGSNLRHPASETGVLPLN